MKNVHLRLRIVRGFNNKNDSISQVFHNKYIYKVCNKNIDCGKSIQIKWIIALHNSWHELIIS